MKKNTTVKGLDKKYLNLFFANKNKHCKNDIPLDSSPFTSFLTNFNAESSNYKLIMIA